MANEYINSKVEELHTQNMLLRRELKVQDLKLDLYRVLTLLGWGMFLGGMIMGWYGEP